MAVTAVTLNRSVGGATRFETEIATRDPAWVKAIVLFLSLGFFVLFLLLPLSPCSWKRCAEVGALCSGADRSGYVICHSTNPTNRHDSRPSQSRVRRFGRVGDHQVRFPQKTAFELADRSAFLSFTGHCGPYLCARIRCPGLARPLTRGTRHQNHFCLEWPDEGCVLLDGEDASHRDVRERQVNFVFQHYALFRHMTVAENVALGLRVKPRATRPTEAQINARV